MDFNFSIDQEKRYSQVIELCREHIPPGLDQRAHTVTDTVQDGYPETFYRAMANAGLLALTSDVGYGVLKDTTDTVITAEALAACSYTAFGMYYAGAMVRALLSFTGTQEQKERYLSSMAEREVRFAFALTEPDAGSDINAMQCSAERTQAGDYVLNGCKNYVTGAAHAHYIAIVARAPGIENIRDATNIFLVPQESPGMSVENHDAIAGNAIGCCEVTLRNVKITEESRIGAENQGWGSVTLAVGYSRLLVAAAALGLAQTVFQEIQDYAANRQQFGQPIDRFQAISHRLADMATEIEAMRLLTYQAASLIDDGDLGEKQISMAKVYCSEKLQEIVVGGMKILGGRACLTSTTLVRSFNQAMMFLCLGGTNEVQRTFISKCLSLE